MTCTSCGAALPAASVGLSVATCAFCGQTYAADPKIVWSASYERAVAELEAEAPPVPGPVIRLGDVPYVVERPLARGECSDAVLARRARRLTERVVLKQLRDEGDADLLDREAAALRALAASRAPGSEHFTRRVPSLVARGRSRGPDGAERSSVALRYHAGFFHTFASARAEHAAGLAPPHAVWTWRRVLEALGWAHRSGWAHGAVLPQHLVVHPRDHGVLVVGWSCAARLDRGERLVAASAADAAFYPASFGAGARVTREADVAMSARCVVHLLGGDPRTGDVPADVPDELATLLRQNVEPERAAADAWALDEAVRHAAKRAFGPPRFHPLSLSGF
jgi:hypothetical protein